MFNNQWKKFKRALLEHRNLRRADGFSPAELFLGRRLRGALPTLPSHTDFKPEEVNVGAERRSKNAEKAKARYDEKACDLPPLRVGQRVMIQDAFTLRWTHRGIITEARDNGRSFFIEIRPGCPPVLLNRRFLRPDPDQDVDNADKADKADLKNVEAKDDCAVPAKPQLRRSKRLQKKQTGK